MRPLLDALRRHCEAGQAAAGPDDHLHEQHRAARARRARASSAPRSASPTTPRRHASTPRPGCSTATAASRPPTSARRTSPTRRRSPGWSGTSASPAARNPDVVAKMAAVFASYWESGDFVSVRRGRVRDERTAGRRPTDLALMLSPIEIELRPFQERLLEQIERRPAPGPPPQPARRRDRHRQDRDGGGRLRAPPQRRSPRAACCSSPTARRSSTRASPPSATRCATPAFGEKWVGGERPHAVRARLRVDPEPQRRRPRRDSSPTHFDVVIVDEFHHAAAPSYEALLDHVEPVELLGLTATPERSDGLAVLRWFDGRIAAELRLWDAIDQQHLAPFVYFGIHDGLDLRDIPWRRGRGYDVDGARRTFYTADHAWARLVVEQVRRKVADPSRMRALGFCVSVEHARFMAARFTEPASPAVAVWGDSRRRRASAGAARSRRRRTCELSSPSTSSTRASTSRPSTRCCCCAPPRAPRCSSSNSAEACGRRPARALCTVLDFVGTIARSSASTAASARCSAARARTSSGRSSRASRSCPPAATWSSIRSRGRSCCAASARRSRARGASAATSCARSATSAWATYLDEQRPRTRRRLRRQTTAGRTCAVQPACRRAIPDRTSPSC